MHKGRVKNIEGLGDETAIFWIEPYTSIGYTAGQFVQVGLPHDTADSRGDKRWFTLASSPSEKLLGFCTRLPAESSSYKDRLKRLKPGDEILISEAMGDFVLPQLKSQPLIFIAAGIGATPFRSIIKWLIDKKEKRRITMYQIAANSGSLLFKDIFQSAGIEHNVLLRDNYPSRKQMQTEVVDSVSDVFSGDPYSLVFIAGPKGLVKQYSDELIRKGIPETSMVLDYFLGY